jgi:hypothetical protein
MTGHRHQYLMIAELVRQKSLGGVELDIPAREPMREPPRFEE